MLVTVQLYKFVLHKRTILARIYAMLWCMISIKANTKNKTDMIEPQDFRVVQLVCSGLLACGLLITAATSLLFQQPSGGTSVSEVTRANTLSWSPRGFLGSGPPGKSPVFGIMWSLIYAGQLYLAIVLLITALQDNSVDDPVALFTACASCFAATSTASFWTPIFTLNTPPSFIMSTILLLMCAIITTTGAIAGKPFLDGNVNQPLVDAGITLIAFFAGWTLVAIGLSIGITTRVFDRGVGAKSSEADEAASLTPLILSVVVAVLAIVFASPAIALPLFLSLFFVPKLFSRWQLWIALIVSAVGVGVGIVMVFVYRGTGAFW
jgi:hypothetical protein